MHVIRVLSVALVVMRILRLIQTISATVRKLYAETVRRLKKKRLTLLPTHRSTSGSVTIKKEDVITEVKNDEVPKAFVDDTNLEVTKKYRPVITSGYDDLGIKIFEGVDLFSHSFEAAIKFRNAKDCNDKVIFGVKGVEDTYSTKKSSKASKSGKVDDQGTVMNRDWFCPVKIYHQNNLLPTLIVGFYPSLSDNRVLPIEMTAVTNLDALAGENFTWKIQKRSRVSLLQRLKSKNRIVEINHDFSENEANKKFQIPNIDERD